MNRINKIVKNGKVSLLLIFITLLVVYCKKPLVSPDRIKGVFTEDDLKHIEINDDRWNNTFETVVKLETQEIAEPKLTEPGVQSIRVKALHNGAWVAFILSWDDPTRDLVAQLGRFSDSAAIQFSATSGDLPDDAMGGPPDAATPVLIHQWKSVWQEASLGKLKGIKSFYPNTWSDLYIFEMVKEGSKDEMEKVYTTSVASQNPLAHYGTPVRDLEALGFSSLAYSSEQTSQGYGKWEKGKWTVVIRRPLVREQGLLQEGKIQYAAFAVWDGSHGEVGARKMRSIWIPLQLLSKEKAK